MNDEGDTIHGVSMTGVENLLFWAGAESGKIYEKNEWNVFHIKNILFLL